MKILHIISKLNVGGAERVVVNLVNICSEKGLDVSLLSLLDRGELSEQVDKSVEQYFLNRRGKFSLRSFYRFYRIVSGYNLLHVHTRHTLRYVVLARVLFFYLHFPAIVYHDHTGVLTGSKVLKLLFRFIKGYISVNNRNVEWASLTMKLTKTYLLPNIVRRTDSCEVTRNRDFVMVGNIRVEKNYPFIFELSQKFEDEIDIYGRFINDDYRRDIEELKPEKVNIISGESDIQKILGRYEMALHCAPVETGPLVLIEYLAQGIPFVTYNTGEVVEQIRGELSPFIVHSFDVDDWIRTIEGVKKMIKTDLPGLQKRMKSVYEKNYSENQYFEKCMRIYKSL